MGTLLRGLRARGRADLYEIAANARKCEVNGGNLKLGVSDDFVWHTVSAEESVAMCDEILGELKLKFCPYRADAREKELEAAIERMRELGGDKFMIK